MSDSKIPPTEPDQTPTNILGRTTEPYSTGDKPPTPPTVAAPGAPLPFEAPKGYEIIAKIAQSGQGIVYKAKQKVPSRVVALKFLLGGTHATEEEKKRFIIEANAAAALNHPGICPIYEVDQENGQWFSMEYVEGPTLSDFIHPVIARSEAKDVIASPPDVGRAKQSHEIATGGQARPRDDKAARPLPHAVIARSEATKQSHHVAQPPPAVPSPAPPRTIKDKLDLFLKICDAVTHAHIHGVIHRDLKPSNIKIDPNGNPRLLDFGLAKMAELGTAGPTQAGDIMGTIPWMSPEQTHGRPQDIDTRTDVYSLGLILYNMLTGQMPYAVDLPNPVAIFRNIQEAEPRRPSLLLRELRGDLETILLKSLAKEKDRRYQSVADFARDVRHYLNNEPIEAKPSTAWYRIRKTVQRHKAGAATILLTVIGFLIAFGWILYLMYQTEIARQNAVAAAEREARETYFAKIGLVANKIKERQFDQAQQLLSSCQAQFRNWEWGRLRLLCHLDVKTLMGHSDWVCSVSFSPDGKRIASGSVDRTVRIWDVETCNELMAIRGHSKEVMCVAWSADGKCIASGSGDRTVKIWDANTGREWRTLSGHSNSVTSIAFSPDGKRLVSGTADVSFGGQVEIRVWDVKASRCVRTLIGHSKGILSLVFSPDGKRIVSGGWDNMIKVWEADTGRELTSLKQPHVAWPFAISRDGARVASGGRDGALIVWDPDGKPPEATTDCFHSGPINCVAFSPNGECVAAGGMDGTLKVWHVETFREEASLSGHSGSINSIAFSPDGKRMAWASLDKTIKIWDTDKGKELTTIMGHSGKRPTFSPDGKQIAGGGEGNTVIIWDAKSARQLLTLQGHSGKVWCVAFSTDGKRIASASDDGTVKIWDSERGEQLRTLARHSHGAYSVVFSPDRIHLASADGDGIVRIWDSKSGEELIDLKGHPLLSANTVAFSSDGKHIALADGHNTAKICSVETGRELTTLRGHSKEVTAIAFSPCGDRIASGSMDMTVKIWAPQSGQEIITLKGHGNAVNSVAFSPDGERIASGSDDRTVRIWDTGTGRELMTLTGHGKEVFSVAFSPDGKYMASVGRDGTIMVWPAADWKTPEGGERTEGRKQ